MGTTHYCRAVHLTSWHTHTHTHSCIRQSWAQLVLWNECCCAFCPFKEEKRPTQHKDRKCFTLKVKCFPHLPFTSICVNLPPLPRLCMSRSLSQSRQAELLPSRAHCRKSDPMTHSGLRGQCCRWSTRRQTQRLCYSNVTLDAGKDINTVISDVWNFSFCNVIILSFKIVQRNKQVILICLINKNQTGVPKMSSY